MQSQLHVIVWHACLDPYVDVDAETSYEEHDDGVDATTNGEDIDLVECDMYDDVTVSINNEESSMDQSLDEDSCSAGERSDDSTSCVSGTWWLGFV